MKNNNIWTTIKPNYISQPVENFFIESLKKIFTAKNIYNIVSKIYVNQKMLDAFIKIQNDENKSLNGIWMHGVPVFLEPNIPNAIGFIFEDHNGKFLYVTSDLGLVYIEPVGFSITRK